MSPLSIIVSERSQAQKATCYLILFIRHFRKGKKKKLVGTKTIAVVVRAWGPSRGHWLRGERKIWDIRSVLFVSCDGGYIVWYTCLKLIEIYKGELHFVWIISQKTWVVKNNEEKRSEEWGLPLLHCWIFIEGSEDVTWRSSWVHPSSPQSSETHSLRDKEEKSPQYRFHWHSLESPAQARANSSFPRFPLFFFLTRCHLFSRVFQTCFIF